MVASCSFGGALVRIACALLIAAATFSPAPWEASARAQSAPSGLQMAAAETGGIFEEEQLSASDVESQGDLVAQVEPEPDPPRSKRSSRRRFTTRFATC